MLDTAERRWGGYRSLDPGSRRRAAAALAGTFVASLVEPVSHRTASAPGPDSQPRALGVRRPAHPPAERSLAVGSSEPRSVTASPDGRWASFSAVTADYWLEPDRLELSCFVDGFEAGDTAAWSATRP